MQQQILNAPAASRGLLPGFADPVNDAQTTFRTALQALAHPGRVHQIVAETGVPAGQSTAMTALLLTLVDVDPPLWLPRTVGADVLAFLRFHCACPIVPSPALARFAAVPAGCDAPALSACHQGDPAYPDLSTTLLMDVASLSEGEAVTLSGPGIQTRQALSVDGLPDGFWREWRLNHQRFPLGVDVTDMYVAVKGGERAILNSYRMLDDYRRGDREIPELSLDQIREQMPLAVSRVMAEGSLYDPQLASLALKQAAGDVIEAVFLLRAYRTTLSRYGYTQPIDTGAMRLQRRISSTFKDVPGGQILGPTYDYTQRLLDFSLEAQREADALPPGDQALDSDMPRVTALLAHDDLIDAEAVPEGDPEPFDLTRQPLDFPASRAARLQNLARADEGFLLSMGSATARWKSRCTLKNSGLP
ncbi:hypothetical protein G6F35_010268 [Rhizopus arrhizus]|nr:hypothetical protein G6F35_010268 [Rhizopus arrhizus]